MKVRIELVDNLAEDEVIIRCGRVDDSVQKLQQYISELSAQRSQFTYFKNNQEFYFPTDQVLFFETEGEYLYAHTAKDAYRVKHRLYELEDLLPRYFVRASKSTIVNSRQVYSITRNLTASSLVTFINSHKHVYVSRNYYQQLRQLMRKESK